MRHAYLIIAHNEFEVLQTLVSSLDDERNTLFVHIDRKSEEMPILHTTRCNLVFAPYRHDVRWGDVSQIETELYLMEIASGYARFDYYHVISGVTLPLVSVDALDAYFEDKRGRSVFSPFEGGDFKKTETYKVRYYNLFTRWVAKQSLKKYAQFLWAASNHVQKRVNVSRNPECEYYSAANWCSLTDAHLSFLVAHKKDILRKYRFTYCADEVFAPTELLAEFPRTEFVADTHYLFVEWAGTAPRIVSMNEIPDLSDSGYIFARKFSRKK